MLTTKPPCRLYEQDRCSILLASCSPFWLLFLVVVLFKKPKCRFIQRPVYFVSMHYQCLKNLPARRIWRVGVATSYTAI
uniref:Uncharacterized protein n=1 Tax=Astyanax mexicanus TaxID=7994 RepID=A0A3B1JNR4_ASTMX